jgi:hypothetical protein
MLRSVAERKGIVVPSLVADLRAETADGEGDVLADAAAAVERAGADGDREPIAAVKA